MLMLLPTPSATLLLGLSGHVQLYGPHAGIWLVPTPAQIIDVQVDMVKMLFGTVTDFVDRMFGESEHPFLEVFAGQPDRLRWQELLLDAERSVTVTDDQLQFRQWLASPTTNDRQAERLCRRYAGQAPHAILRQLRFSAEFCGNLQQATYLPQGHFADQSHYIRSGRELTGYTPVELKNLSDSFYLRDVIHNKLESSWH